MPGTDGRRREVVRNQYVTYAFVYKTLKANAVFTCFESLRPVSLLIRARTGVRALSTAPSRDGANTAYHKSLRESPRDDVRIKKY